METVSGETHYSIVLSHYPSYVSPDIPAQKDISLIFVLAFKVKITGQLKILDKLTIPGAVRQDMSWRQPSPYLY
jgi:hypothetical protein